MNTTRDDTRRETILTALDDYVMMLDGAIREKPLSWAPCYEALDANGEETDALNPNAEQWSVCGMLRLAKVSSKPYCAEARVARNMAQRLLGLIAHRILNYEDPEAFFTFATNGAALRNAGGSIVNIHRIEREIGLSGVQDIITIFRKRLPELKDTVATTDLEREYA
ncbi:MAG: hypothetical protein OXI16_13920 [Chloroflexota bacterium]|nr:hypothetical protein [Chloroflexota bacterium]